MKSRALVYAVNDQPFYLEAMRVSIRTAREQNKDLAIEVFVYGSVPHCLRRFLSRRQVRVTQLPRSSQNWATFLKWHVLKFVVGYEQIVLLDADTIFFEDPDLLFQRHKDRHFWARQESGTSAGAMDWNQVLYEAQAKSLSAKVLPIFNSSIMLFNQNFHSQIAERFDEMKRIHQLLLKRQLEFPSDNFHFRDEVIASLVMGRLPKFSYSFFPIENVTWFCEWKAWRSSCLGIVMHIATFEYRGFVNVFSRLSRQEKSQIRRYAPVEKAHG